MLSLIVPGQPSTSYGYDQSGDTTSITTTGTISTGLSYDTQARPVGVTLKDGTSVSLSYNSTGQRSRYVVSKPGQPTLTQTFTYRGDELGQAVVVTGTTTYTDTYIYTPDGAPLELLRQQNGTTSRYWYVLDGRGNVAALTDSTGNVVNRCSYDVWGALTSVSEQVPQRLRYAGYWYDQELGWYWVSVRSYDPSLKRWLQPDPSQQDGVRTYVYVGDDPIDATDPTGLGDGASIGGTGNAVDTAVTFLIVGAAAVVAVAASPAVFTAAGIAVGSVVVIGVASYVVTQVQIGHAGAVTVPGCAPRAGDVQSSAIAGGTTLTTPGQITLPAYRTIPQSSRPRRSSRWTCESSCNVAGPGSHCTGRLYGLGIGHSEDDACRNAKRDAGQKAPRGCYGRHCRCFNCHKTYTDGVSCSAPLFRPQEPGTKETESDAEVRQALP